jgi:LacI family transcriptional regulator
VSVDDVLGGDLAVTHLIEAGRSPMAFVGGPLELVQVADRLAGARRACDRVARDPEELVVLRSDALTIAEGRRAGERLAGLPARQRPDGVFCANDLVALGLLQQLSQLRMRVPDDIAIVGYDDIEYAAAAAVPLTSVSQPRHLLGRVAVELAMTASAEGTQHEHSQIVLSPELVVRTSTGFRPVGTTG